MAVAPDIKILDHDIQALTLIGSALNRVLLIADDGESHNKDWTRESAVLSHVTTLLSRSQKDEIAVSWQRDAADSRPHPRLLVASRHILHNDDNNIELLQRTLSNQDLEALKIDLLNWFRPGDLAQRGFRQHLTIVETALRRYHDASYGLERRKLRQFFWDYMQLANFVEFESALNFGSQHTAFLTFLSSPPKIDKKTIPVGISGKHHWKIERTITAFLDYDKHFHKHWHIVNSNEDLPDKSKEISRIVRDLKSKRRVTCETVAMAHMMVSYRLRWVQSSATYLRHCLDTDIRPQWSASTLLPFPEAMYHLTSMIDELSIVFSWYWRCVDRWDGGNNKHSKLPVPQKLTKALFSTMNDPSNKTDQSELADETANPLEPNEFNPVLERTWKLPWGSACATWLEHLTSFAHSARFMLDHGARYVKLLDHCPPTRVLVWAEHSMPPFPHTILRWDKAVLDAYSLVAGNRKSRASQMVQLLQQIELQDDEFKAEIALTDRAKIPLETLLMLYMARASRNAAAPVPSAFPPFIATARAVPFVAAAILDAIAAEAWPAKEETRRQMKIGEAAGVAVEPAFEQTALPLGTNGRAAEAAAHTVGLELHYRLREAKDLLKQWIEPI